jgi:hypothetical protein
MQLLTATVFVPPCRTLAAPSVAGALQLVRCGATLATGPATTTNLIDACAALARAHLQLPASDPSMLCQVLTAGFRKTPTYVLMSKILIYKTYARRNLDEAYADLAAVSGRCRF